MYFSDILIDCTISPEYYIETESGLVIDDEYQSEEEEEDAAAAVASDSSSEDDTYEPTESTSTSAQDPNEPLSDDYKQAAVNYWRTGKKSKYPCIPVFTIVSTF